MLVSDARSLLLKYVGPLGATPYPEFLSTLNQLRKRFFDSGKWNGLVIERVLTTTSHVFTLPTDCESILGAQIEGRPVVVYSRYHEYLPGGPGEVTATSGASILAIIDQGDREYKIMGKADSKPTELRLTCKLRYKDLQIDSDVVNPDNVGALKLGLMSLAYEDQNDLERAEQYFSKALMLLNGEVKEARGASQSVLQQSPHGFHTGRLRSLF